ncbi:MAG: GLPGLI family protein [Mucilaginibacter sp.]
MKSIIITLALLLTCNFLFAQQARFVTSGTIEFEKTVNMYAVIKSDIDEKDVFDNMAFDAFKKNNPQFKKLKSTLTFGDNKSLYTPVVPEESSRKMGDVFADQINNTFTDIKNHSTIIHKEIYSDEFLVKDSLRKIKWKITDETREIAGYTCRRANGLIMDSVYVVAFYTNKIPVSGGPESFTGLPGMILGVALPHENMTWFATKVTDVPVPPTALATPKKGKPTNRKQLYDTLKGVMKNWGKSGPYELKIFML